MVIYLYWCGEIDTTFTDRDKPQVDKMCSDLDSKWYWDDSMWEYHTDEGRIAYWRGDDGKTHGNVFGHPESIIPESSIANGLRNT